MNPTVLTRAVAALALLAAASANASLFINEQFAYPLGAALANDASHGYNLTTTGGANGIPYDTTGGDPTNYVSVLGTYLGANSTNSPGTGLYRQWGGSALMTNGLSYSQGALTLVTSSNAMSHFTGEWLGDVRVYRNAWPTNITNGDWGVNQAVPADAMASDPFLAYKNYEADNPVKYADTFGVDGKVIYFSFLAQFNDTNAWGEFNIKSPKNQNLNIGISRAPLRLGQFFITHDKGGVATAYGITNGVGVTASTNVTLFVGRLTYIGTQMGIPNGTSNLAEVWVNPPLDQPLGTPELKLWPDGTSLTNLDLTFYSISTRADPAKPANLTVDEIRFGTTAADVMPYTSTAAPAITASASGSTLTLEWGVTGWTLQSQTKLLSEGLSSTGWVDVSPDTATLTSTNLTVDPNSGAVFYRLKK